MADVERLLTAALVQVDVVDPAASRRRSSACAQYFAELSRALRRRLRSGAAASPPAPTSCRLPAGAFLLARLRGEPVGCGALKLHGDAPAELKRMWVATAARGLGLGRRLLDELERVRAANGAPRRPAGDEPRLCARRSRSTVGRLPRGRRVQRRAVRPPLVREAAVGSRGAARPVTGAGRGIGEAIAAGLAQAGWRVAIASRDEQALARVAEATGAVAVPLDVTDAAAVEAAVAGLGPSTCS